MSQYIYYLYSIPAVLIAITLHEYAHGFVSWKLGDPTPEKDGRLSLNPIHHLDLLGTLCLLVFHMGWAKPVQINPGYYKNPKLGTVLVSLAGPCMNFIIAFISMFGVVSTYTMSGMVWDVIYYLCLYLVIINIGLGIFNLIPIPPLDGSKVLSAILPEKLYFGYMKYERYFMLILLVAVYFGILSTPIDWLNDKVVEAMFRVVNAIL
jgi:Zn-dependent protease